MVRRTALFALVLAVVLGGCVGFSPTGNSTPTATTAEPQPATTTTPHSITSATTSPFDCPPFLSVDRMEGNVTKGDGPLVAYENLSEDRQRKFVRALENGDLELQTSDERGDPNIVEYEGERYRAVVHVC